MVNIAKYFLIFVVSSKDKWLRKKKFIVGFIIHVEEKNEWKQ